MNESPRTDETKVLSRRSLFRTIGVAAGGAMLLGLPKFLGGWAASAEAAVRSSYASGAVALELDGQFVGILVAVEGGSSFADVVPEAVGPDMIQRKRPGPPRFEDIVLDVDFSQITKPLSGWIGDTLSRGPAPKNGAIVYTDFNYKEVKRLEFMGAVITEIGTPPVTRQERRLRPHCRCVSLLNQLVFPEGAERSFPRWLEPSRRKSSAQISCSRFRDSRMPANESSALTRLWPRGRSRPRAPYRTSSCSSSLGYWTVHPW